MVINGPSLLHATPIKDMLDTKVHDHGVSHGLAEVGYDIRLKQEIKFEPHRFSEGEAICVDGVCTLGRFTIASAIEEFDMPTHLMGIVHDKSTWARRGLSVFNTVIEPGWKGFLTLELVFHGSEQVVIPAGSGIAQVIFHRVAHHAIYEGKYQNQADRPVAALAS